MNYEGQLGHKDFENKTVAKVIEFLRNKKVVKIPCSCFNSAFITADESIYLCGSNDYRQIIASGDEKVNVPTLLKTNLKVTHFYGGNYHSVIVSKEGDVYSNGMNSYGQCGMGNEKSVEEFTKIPNLKVRVEATVKVLGLRFNKQRIRRQRIDCVVVVW